MKKLFILSFLFFVSFSTFGQIQKNFFDCVVGVTTYEEAQTKLKANGYNFQASDKGTEKQITIESCTYGGTEWEVVVLTFYKNVLFQTFFDSTEITKPLDDVVMSYSSYRKKFLDKYEDYLLPGQNMKETKLFFVDLDSDMAMIINLATEKFGAAFCLSYLSYSMYSERLEENDNAF